MLTDPPERSASVFSRSPAVAERLYRSAGDAAVYAEVELGAPREEFLVYVTELDPEPSHPFRHWPRVLPSAELDGAIALLHETSSASAERWARVAYDAGERCLGVEVDGVLAGVAWVLVVGTHARLHSLTVRPGFRRLGIGTDLVAARLLFARERGARRALSEISVRNAASRAVAERAGMRPEGRLYLNLGPRLRPPGELAGSSPGASPTPS